MSKKQRDAYFPNEKKSRDQINDETIKSEFEDPGFEDEAE